MKDLLIDVGSTNIKYCLSNNGEIGKVFKVAFPDKLNLPEPFFEVDAYEILNIILDIINESRAERVLFSTQMHGWLLGDKTGKLITNYVSWQDTRAKNFNKELNLTAKSGVSLKANLPRASVLVTLENNIQIKNNAKVFYTLGSFIAYSLTGNNQTHITDGAPSGYYRVTDLKEYSDGLVLPKITNQVECVGVYNNKKIYTPIGDQQSSILGANATSEQYILNLGTAAQLCYISKEFVEGDFESRPYFNGQTLCTVTGLLGGKFIRENYNDSNVENVLFKNYYSAMKRLPKCEKILVTGGTLNY